MIGSPGWCAALPMVMGRLRRNTEQGDTMVMVGDEVDAREFGIEGA